MADYPISDPAWDYARLWEYLNEMEDHFKDLRSTMQQIEDATPNSDAALRYSFLEIQALCFRASNLLKPSFDH